tara:strand:- start:731 stop:1540 length:810 start_codon:yes stop_codon:yes gene_type:complete
MNLVNGKPNSSIKIFDRGFLYGDAVFETILVENKIPQNLTQHLQRLKKGTHQLKIKNFNIELLRKHIKKALSDQNNCVLGINITRGEAFRRGYDLKLSNKPSIIITTSKVPKYPKTYYTKGINTKFSNIKLFLNKNIDCIKHCNKIDYILATKEISKKYPEIILCNEKDYIIEGTSCNIFFIKNQKLFTPNIKGYGVEGVMKNIIINTLKKNGISTKSLNIKKTDVRNYHAAFFCNSIRKIWNIRSIGNTKFKNSDLVNNIRSLIDGNV